jgi:hypothetical protein
VARQVERLAAGSAAPVPGPGQAHFRTSGDPDRFATVAGALLGRPVEARRVVWAAGRLA